MSRHLPRRPPLRRPPVPRRVPHGLVVLALLVSTAFLTPPTAAAVPVTDPQLAKKLASVMKDSRVTRARNAAIVIDAASGSTLYDRNGDRPTTPASNTKIVTALAAMDTLGPTYRFKTQVIRRNTIRNGTLNGRLYLKGYGDPTTRQTDYAALARAVQRAGVRRVQGDLVVDASYFDSNRYNATWSRSYRTSYYAAEVSALTVAADSDLDPGTVFVNYAPGTRGKPAKVSFSPAAAGNYIRVLNRSTTSARGTGSTFSASRSSGSSTITVRGRVALGRGTASKLITVYRPELYAGAVFRAELGRLGISVVGATRSQTTPASHRTTLGTDYSMTLSQLLVPFMKFSNNGHAEALTKAMGAAEAGSGSWRAGLGVTKAFLVRARAWQSGMVLTDGSGLTRSNKLTPRSLVKAMRHARTTKKWFAAFYNALPVAGIRDRYVGGTLRNRMNGTRAANNAHAKTGTLTGVTALSGFVRGRGGRLYLFSTLSEHDGNSPRPVENTFVIALADWKR